MTPPSRNLKNLKYILITVLCGIAGFGFYKTTNDLLTTLFFTAGLLGILASWMREGALKREE